MAPTRTKEAIIENTPMVDIQLQAATNHSTLAGRVQVIEATGVSLDHTAEAEGVAASLTNDYQTSAGPQVDHFSSLQREWLEEN